MSYRPGRRLMHRSERDSESSPASRGSGHRGSQAPARQPTALPDYEPPSCPLSDDAKKQIEQLRNTRDYEKYKKHIGTAMTLVKSAAVSSNDRLFKRLTTVEKNNEKRKARGISNDDKPEDHIEAEHYANQLEKKVDGITAEMEEALRVLIDYGDELRMQESILEEVVNAIPDAPPPRRRDAGEEDAGEEDADDDGAGVSAVDLLKKEKEDYMAKYTSKSMRDRYAENNEYKSFKRGVHDVQHQSDDAPPPPHAKTWFDESTKQAKLSRRGANKTNNNASNSDDSDDDVVIAGATRVLKCIFTLRYFNEPYSSDVCPHIFEKSAIVDYYRENATAYPTTNAKGERVVGPKKFKCPQTGCEAMLAIEDFHLDEVVLRQVKRAQAAENGEDDNDDDDDEEDEVPRGTQRKRPQDIDSDDDTMDIDAQDKRRKKAAQVKREAAGRSRGLSKAPSRARDESSEPGDSEIEVLTQG